MASMATVERTVRSPQYDFVGAKFSELFKDRGGRALEHGVRFDGAPPESLIARQEDTKKLCDAFYIIGFICVSFRLRELIESFEPNKHQFFPITLEAKNGTPYTDKYFIFNPCTIMDAYLDVADSKWQELPNLMRPYRKGFEPVTLSSQEIAGQHVWMGGFMGSNDLFVSDALRKRIEKERMRYFWFQPLTERDVPWKPEVEMPQVLAWLEADPMRFQELIRKRPEWVRKHRPDWLQYSNSSQKS